MKYPPRSRSKTLFDRSLLLRAYGFLWIMLLMWPPLILSAEELRKRIQKQLRMF